MADKVFLIKNQAGNDSLLGFECPGCKTSHAVPVNEMAVQSWQWNRSFEKPTILPSLLVREYDGSDLKNVCHSFVTEGKLIFLNDCTHAFAGKTVVMEDVK